MNIRLWIAFWVVFICRSTPPLAQGTLLTKTEQQYRYIGTDSIPLVFKKLTYSPSGLLVDKVEFYYNNNPKEAGTLWREERMSYDSLTQRYTLKKTQYAKDKDPSTEKREALYWVYDNDPAKAKTRWSRTIDPYGDYIREDTSTYDKKGQLTEYCLYNYQGNTSLNCDHYRYNQKGQVKRWFTTYHWTTVDIKGDVINKKSTRRDVRYRYNQQGKQSGFKGRYFASKISNTKLYDPLTGHLIQDETIHRQRIKVPKKKRKEEKRRFYYINETHLSTYNSAGKPLSDIYSKDTLQTKAFYWTYQSDTLLQSYESKEKGVPVEKREYTYDTDGKITVKLTHQFDKIGKPKYLIRTSFDAQGNPIEELQLSGDSVISTLKAVYDDQKNILLSTLYLKTDTKYEQTIYTYEYR